MMQAEEQRWCYNGMLIMELVEDHGVVMIMHNLI